MNYFRVYLGCGLLAALPARAVYAPIPEQEQTNDLAFNFTLGVSHDSNIFGGATGALASTVWHFSPKAAYSHSLAGATTFVSLSYQLTLDRFDDRPGEKTLDSHAASARLAHQFSPASTIDIAENYQSSRNPESLLNGIPLNADQSFQRNELDGNFTASLGPKIGATLKARTVYFDYRNSVLARSLNRLENLYGLSGDYDVLPETKAVAEYRHQDVFYDKLGETKNKRSDFVMGGADYALAKKFTTSGRLGVEFRHRSGAGSTTAPYAEFSGKYDYADGSFLTGGYTYTIDEPSDTTRFNDSKVNRFFVNAQHTLTPLLVASGSLTYDSAILQGRRPLPNIAEDTTRLGVALSYLPTKHWTVSASFDDDHVNSDDASRRLDRQRFGLNAGYAF
jgi:predicted porin